MPSVTVRKPRSGAGPAMRAKARTGLRHVWSEHKLLLALLAAGLVLRLLLSLWYWPVNGGFGDSSAILQQTEYGIFRDPLRLPGYPFFVRIAEIFWPHVFFIVLLQYAMGFITATLLYAIVWRVTGSKLAGAIPAAYVLLSGDHLVSEHSILGEAPMVFFTTVAIALWVLAVHTDRRWLWLAPGAAFAIAGTVRFGPGVLAAAVVGTAILTSGSLRERGRRSALMLAGALPILIAWGVAQGDATGKYAPGYSATGWSLYSRVAPIADCDKTDVGDDLQFLCDDPTPIKHPDVSKRRGGPGYYLYRGGPAVERFGAPTSTEAPGADTLQKFAIQVILQQPLDYANTVTSDMLKYFDRGVGYERWYMGTNTDEQDIARRAPEGSEALLLATGKETGITVPEFKTNENIDRLEDWQRIFRLQGVGLVVVLLLALWASLWPGRGRREAALLTGTGLLFALLPAMTQAVSYRHSIPVFCFLVAAAGIAVGRLATRGRADAADDARPAPADTTPPALEPATQAS